MVALKTTSTKPIEFKEKLKIYLDKNWEPIELSMTSTPEDAYSPLVMNYERPAPSFDIEPFRDALYRLIDLSGMTDVETYKKADIDRKLFSKLKNDQYHPSKETVFRLILALELTIKNAKELLEQAGYAFSRSSKIDLIVKFCIENKKYNLVEVNELLYEYTEKTI